ncbi:MAG: diguanylate cyclase [Synechococcus sp.]|nr:diguanylate cyclase [Synechococcus sp.]
MTAARHRYLLVNGITAVGFAVLALTTHWIISNRVQKSLRANLSSEAADIALHLGQTVRESVRSMRGLTAHLSVDPSLDEQTFQRLARQSVNAQDGLIIVEWQPIVPAAARRSFELAVRQQGGALADFHLWEPTHQNEGSRPALARDPHVPVLYVYQSSNQGSSTMGLDLAFSPERMASKWHARDDGDPVASGLFPVIRFPGDSAQPIGFAVDVPVYNGGIIPGTLDNRKRQIQGFIALVYNLQELIQPSLIEVSRLGLNLTISQQGQSEPRLAVLSGKPIGSPVEERAVIFGTPWTLRLEPTRKFLDSQTTTQDEILPWGISLMGLTVLGFLFALQRNVERLEATRSALIESNASLQRSEQTLRELAVHDPLTNLFNRRGFLERAVPELTRSLRYFIPLALLMLDLDHFKAINDRWGHTTGDLVLQRLARLLEASMRGGDLVGRLGGEEFVILLSHTGPGEAHQIAERLRQEVAVMVHHTALPSPEEFTITVSIGCAMASPGVPIEALLDQADQALYRAKEEGRNRVVLADVPAVGSPQS